MKCVEIIMVPAFEDTHAKAARMFHSFIHLEIAHFKSMLRWMYVGKAQNTQKPKERGRERADRFIA